jgi:hypothetical protein
MIEFDRPIVVALIVGAGLVILGGLALAFIGGAS